MQYTSTRANASSVTGACAIARGIAPDGGLYAPDRFPQLSLDALKALGALPYAERAAAILDMWLPEFAGEAMRAMCESAYERFDTPEVARVRGLTKDVSVLELWHGPTLAFKDMALQLLPRLLAASNALLRETDQTLILVATSGDTGKAALEGFMDKPGVDICVFYPEGGVSRAQELQMATQAGRNTHVVKVRGNFDDAQTGVKRIFTDPAIRAYLQSRHYKLSSANSINLGRLVPQICYYVSAYVDMAVAGRVSWGETIDICVPTGNFGNILAALYAKRMGLPVERLVCASNKNHVLHDFLQTGVYDRNREFYLTTSPSMDILISSNLERALSLFSGRDSARVDEWMRALKQTGRYQVDPETFESMRAELVGGWADEDAVLGEIRRAYTEDNYLFDPHTAVASVVARGIKRDRPMLIVSTASPYKFGRSVWTALTGEHIPDDFACCDRLEAMTGIAQPESIKALATKPILHDRVCDKDGLWDAIKPIVEGRDA